MRISQISIGLLFIWCAIGCEGQDQPPATSGSNAKAFEVVSIRPNNSGDPGGGYTLPDGDRFVGTTVSSLIKGAYETLNDSQLVGMPSWAKSDRYDVDAKVDAATADEWKSISGKERWKQERSMLQAMLVDRFKLKVHFETKELPVYELVIAKGGLKMKESAPNEESWERVGPDTAVGHAVSISNLIHAIPNDGRPIEDKTGLGKRKYNFDLKWSSDDHSSNTDSGPSLFTALEEQLGLKLVSAKSQQNVLVIDHVEKPSPN